MTRQFATRYPAVTQVTLNENFRSSHAVVATARQVIERNQQRLPKAMVSCGTRPYEPGDIAARRFDTVEAEAIWIANTIRRLYGTAYTDRPECPPQWRCRCNALRRQYNAPPPDHEQPTDAIEVAAFLHAAELHDTMRPLQSSPRGPRALGGTSSAPTDDDEEEEEEEER